METTRFGRTGCTVSRLGFGGAPAGLTNYLDDYDPRNAQQRRGVQAALEAALALGITYFDTAPDYGDGASESIFGEVLAGAADSIFVATKVNRNTQNLRRSVETSLQRLGRTSLDLIQIHGTSYSPAETTALLAPGGLLAQMEALRDEGLVRFVGFTSEDNNPAIYRMMKSGRFDTLQIAYNLLHQHPYEPTRPFGSLLEAQKQEMGICTMRALTSGIFQRWIQTVNPGNDFDYGPALLQFTLSNPLVHIDIDELHRKYPRPATD